MPKKFVQCDFLWITPTTFYFFCQGFVQFFSQLFQSKVDSSVTVGRRNIPTPSLDISECPVKMTQWVTNQPQLCLTKQNGPTKNWYQNNLCSTRSTPRPPTVITVVVIIIMGVTRVLSESEGLIDEPSVKVECFCETGANVVSISATQAKLMSTKDKADKESVVVRSMTVYNVGKSTAVFPPQSMNLLAQPLKNYSGHFVPVQFAAILLQLPLL